MEMITAFVLFALTVVAWFVLPGSPAKAGKPMVHAMEPLAQTA